MHLIFCTIDDCLTLRFLYQCNCVVFLINVTPSVILAKDTKCLLVSTIAIIVSVCYATQHYQHCTELIDTVKVECKIVPVVQT